jgi:hypothetical protein
MPGVYKRKECPGCGITHRKRGKHCGASCAAASRIAAPETKEKIADGMREFYQTPEGVAAAAVNNRRVHAIRIGEAPPLTIDEYAVGIPTIYDIPDGYSTDFE